MSSILRSSFRRDRRSLRRRTSLTTDGVLVRYALRQGTVESVKHFFSGKLQHNTDLPLPDGQLPLHVAVDANRRDVVLFLLDQGADINNADPAGWTALHRAVYNGNIPLAKLLIDHGANPSLKAGHLLPADLAMDCDSSMTRLLEEASENGSNASEDEIDSTTDKLETNKRSTKEEDAVPSTLLTPKLVEQVERKKPSRSFSLRRSVRKHTASLFKGVAKRGAANIQRG